MNSSVRLLCHFYVYVTVLTHNRMFHTRSFCYYKPHETVLSDLCTHVIYAPCNRLCFEPFYRFIRSAASYEILKL